MNKFSLNAISPLDGRYKDKIKNLREIFSEYAFIKFRIKIEILWFKKLFQIKEIKELPKLDTYTNKIINEIFDNFNIKDALYIKDIEKNIHHDVKAIEYFLKKKIKSIKKINKFSEFIHFACTSEDINNLAYALMIKSARDNIIIPIWKTLIKNIKNLAIKYSDTVMLTRTHGQIAIPSTLGKEIANFGYRLDRQLNQLKKIEILGKFNGAVGNYNAHVISYPEINWHKISKEFVTNLGIFWNPYTTQIEPHDYIAEFFNCIARFNTIMIDFNRDFWGYISINYFQQKKFRNEVGSSTMPHKINPINFENSEGNLGLCNAIISYFSEKLPISRWQRDLSDSTVLRNLGIAIGYAVIAYQETLKGLYKIEVNKNFILNELNQKWEILSEAIQTIMRRYNISKPYEKLKNLTQGKKITQNNIKNFIDNLNIPEKEKKRIKNITPKNYIGYAKKLAKNL